MSKGLRLDQFKEPAFSSDILKINPQKIYINSVLNSDTEDDFKFLFSLGTKIKKNDLIAIKQIDIYKYKNVNIFSPQDCEVKETKYLINDRDEATSFIILESTDDNSEEYKPDFDNEDEKFKNKEPVNISLEDLVNITYNASVIDETDSAYLFQKIYDIKNNLYHNKIYIDAIDDQPFTSSKESLLLHYPNAVNFAVQTLKKALNLNNIDIIFYDTESYNRENKISKKCIDTPVINLKVNYPVRHYISKKLNYDGYIGIQAILHLARLLINNSYKQTTTFVTISGPSVISPANVEIPIGSSTKEITENFELKAEPKQIILGQILTGLAISEEETPISVSTRSILIFSEHISLKRMECIGCSKCSDVCPQNLLPSYRYKFKQTGDVIFEEFSSEAKCIKCYCCSYICPSHINLV